jgi:hypothetical protein
LVVVCKSKVDMNECCGKLGYDQILKLCQNGQQKTNIQMLTRWIDQRKCFVIYNKDKTLNPKLLHYMGRHL